MQVNIKFHNDLLMDFEIFSSCLGLEEGCWFCPFVDPNPLVLIRRYLRERPSYAGVQALGIQCIE